MKTPSIAPCLSAAAFCLFAHASSAGLFDSVAPGPWENNATWITTPALPSHPDLAATDSASVLAGHTVGYNGLGMSFPPTNGSSTSNFAITNGNALTVDGGTWTHAWADYSGPLSNALAIGASGSSNGTGLLVIDNGGIFDSQAAANILVGQTLATLGLGSGDGKIDINHGTMRIGAGDPSTGFATLAIGADNAAVGFVNVGDDSGTTNSALLDLSTHNAALALGVHTVDPANLNGGAGTLLVKNDGRMTWGTRAVVVGDTLNSSGSLGILAGGSAMGGNSHLIVGQNNNASAMLYVAGSLTKLGDTTIARAGGKGDLSMSVGGYFENGGGLTVGTGTGSIGTAQLGGTSSFEFIEIGRDGGNGTLTVTDGIATVADSGTIATAANGITNGTINLTGGTLQITGDLTTTASASSNATVSLNGGTLDLGGGRLKVDTLNANTGALKNIGEIEAGDSATVLGVTKTSAGTLVLDGINDYTGGTTVLSGAIAVNGSLSVSPTLIGVGATLMGSGELGGTVTVQGTHAPGNSVGTQTFTGPLVYSASSNFAWELFTNTDSIGSADMVAADTIAVAAGATIDLSFDGAGSGVDFNHAFWETKRSWRIASVEDSRTGRFMLGNVSPDSNGTDYSAVGLLYLEHKEDGIDLVWDNINSPIVQWRMAHFGDDYTDESIAGNHANPDGDDLSNLVEYGTGSSPTGFTSNPGNNVEHLGNTITFEYSRSSLATDAGYCVQFAADLPQSPEDDTSVLPGPPPPEEWENTGVTQTMISDNGSIQLWRAEIPNPTNAPRIFIRLKVTN